MRRVVVESPYAGNIARNTAYARAAVRDSLVRGEAPIASHLLYPQPGILREEVPEERLWGIAAGVEWHDAADAVVFYTDLGMSSGMILAKQRAEEHHQTIEIRHLPVDAWTAFRERYPVIAEATRDSTPWSEPVPSAPRMHVSPSSKDRGWQRALIRSLLGTHFHSRRID